MADYNYGDNIDPANGPKPDSPAKASMDYILKRTGGHYSKDGGGGGGSGNRGAASIFSFQAFNKGRQGLEAPSITSTQQAEQDEKNGYAQRGEMIDSIMTSSMQSGAASVVKD